MGLRSYKLEKLKASTSEIFHQSEMSFRNNSTVIFAPDIMTSTSTRYYNYDQRYKLTITKISFLFVILTCLTLHEMTYNLCNGCQCMVYQ